MRFQRTIRGKLTISGVGLHTGMEGTITLVPAPRDSGISFFRRDRGVFIKADVNSVCDTAFATTLGSGATRVKTVEHLLAALYGLGIDNLLIEVEGPEIPVLDGSSAVFVERILKTGLAKQASPRAYLKILRPVAFREGNSEICVFPHNRTLVSYRIHYSHRLLGDQKISLAIDEETFAKQLAPARTFGFLKDVEVMRANGLAKGGSYDNAIILSDTAVLNKSGLRFQDEFIRHKVLDLIGDISLVGFPIMGHIIGVRTGHATNVKFARTLLSMPECWEVVAEADELESEKDLRKARPVPFLDSRFARTEPAA